MLTMMAPGWRPRDRGDRARSRVGGAPDGIESAAMALAARGVRASSSRLSPTVHGEGDKGFVPSLIDVGRAQTGVSAFVGDGSNRWPAVHRLDAAHLFRLAVEATPAGSILRGRRRGRAVRDIAELIGPPAEAAGRRDHHRGGERALRLSRRRRVPRQPDLEHLTRNLLGWRPGHPALVPDLEAGHYFND